MRDAPNDYDPELTEQLLEEGGKRLHESRRLLEALDDQLHREEPPSVSRGR